MAAAALMAFTAATAPDFGETIPSVTVNGSSQLKVTPDILYLSISLDESDSKGKITLDEQRKAMFSALRKCGINIEKQLSVADMSSSFFKRRSSLSSSQYELKVSTADEARKVFDALNAAGITNVDLTRVACSKLDEYRTEARMAAIRNAKERAEQLAGAIGQSIGPCYEITDYTTDTQPVAMRANLMMKNSMAADEAMAAGAEPEVDIKQITITYNVSARFVLNTK